MTETGWEARQAARAAARRQERERVERQQHEQERAARRDYWLARLGPCPCPMDPCPFPPWEYEDVPDWWQGHRDYFQQVRDTGHCPDCGRPVTPQEAIDHDCPNRIALAG
jgi:hypothetical protein